jgi:hypothetical protein
MSGTSPVSRRELRDTSSCSVEQEPDELTPGGWTLLMELLARPDQALAQTLRLIALRLLRDQTGGRAVGNQFAGHSATPLRPCRCDAGERRRN